MITFRYHIVSLVSVFLALAVGIALGGGPLKGGVDKSLVQEIAARKKAEQAQGIRIADLKETRAFDNKVALGTSSALLKGRLKGASVAMVALPGADPGTVTSLSSMVLIAGGRVSGSYRIGSKLVDSGNKGLVDQLGTQLQVDASSVSIPAKVSTYERFGLLLGRAVGTTSPKGEQYDATSENLLAAFSTAGLVSTVGNPVGRADVVLVIAAPGPSTGTNGVAGTVASALADSVQTVVVAGPADAARTGGLIRKIRDDSSLSSKISTVDSAATGAGGVVAMLAIAHDLLEGTGQYGAVDPADGAVPGQPAS